MDIPTEEQRSMVERELSQLFTADEAKDLRGDDLLSYFTEHCSKRDIEICFTSARAKVRDYLHSHDAACGKGSKQPIADCLLNLYPPPSATTVSRLRTQGGTSSSTSRRARTDTWIPPPYLASSQAVRDMVKSPKNACDQYTGPHEPPLLSTVKEVFLSQFQCSESSGREQS